MKLSKRIKMVLPVVIVILISYGQTLRMYFWQDDSALIFKLQNQEGLAGSFGYGIIGGGPYKYLVTPFVPFFPVFGLNPFGYFFIGLATYAFATYFCFRFARALFSLDSKKNNNVIAYFTTLIFAAGYIGSDIMFRVINSWQTNIGLIFGFLTFEHLFLYIKSGNLRSYLYSLVFYLMCVEFVFVRSHSLIAPIIFVLLFTLIKKFSFRNLTFKLVSTIPFGIIFYKKYLTDESFGGPGLHSLYSRIISGEYEIISPLIANIGNSLIPTIFQTRLMSVFAKLMPNQNSYTSVIVLSVFVTLIIGSMFLTLQFISQNRVKPKLVILLTTIVLFVFSQYLNINFYLKHPLWYRDLQSVLSGSLGFSLICFTVLFFTFNYKRKFLISASMLFGLVFASTQIFSYFIQYSDVIFVSTHRYYSYSLIGFAIFYSSISYIFFERKGKTKYLSYFMIFIIVVANSTLSFRYQSRLVNERSVPSAKFYNDLLRYVPKIDKGAAFYFDVSEVPPYGQRFGDFFSVGSMPESTALAIYYGVDRYDILYLTNFDETISKTQKGEIDVSKIYTFYYGENGLIDTTQEMRRQLKGGDVFKTFNSVDEISLSPLTPILLEISLIARKSKLSFVTSPVYQMTTDQKLKTYQYLVSRKEIMRNIKVQSESEWKFREIDNIVDFDQSTVWQGHRIYWHDNEHESFILDLGSIKNIDRFVWENWKTSLSPTKYTIETSVDNYSWKTQVNIANQVERKDGEVVVEVFEPTDARFVRMNILATQSNDSPAIVDVEAIESRFNEVDILMAPKLIDDPLQIVSDDIELLKLYDYASKLALLKVISKSNKTITENISEVPLAIDGKEHTYRVIIPAGGTVLKYLKIDSNIQTDIEILSVKAKNLSLLELNDMNLIKEFSEN